MNPLIGRKKELKKLHSHPTSRKSEFVAVYGRRRVGKTFLIRKAYENNFSFQLTGLANAKMRDQVINICEMKFSIHPFLIDKKYSENLRNKLGSFQQVTQTKKALFLTMISTYGVAENKYSGMVRNDLRMGVLFE